MEKEIADIFLSFEKSLAEVMSIQKESLDILNCQNKLAMHGLEGFKAEFIQDQKTRDAAGIKEVLFERIRDDKELRHPHVKILNHLAAQYDFNKDLFMEVNFSRLVKDCRIGKNKAKEYLDLLIKKDLIESRTDGYRVYYKVKITQ